MIQNFKQFIKESADSNQNPLSVHEIINKPYAEFIERAQERFDIFMTKITELIKDMDIIIETITEELSDVIVGEPIIKVDKYLDGIDVVFNTNIPDSDEAWGITENDEDIYPALDLERKVNRLFEKRDDVNLYIHHEPNEDGNCILKLYKYILDEDYFGDYTDAITKLGEDY